MDKKNIKELTLNIVEKNNGILRIKPTYVARDFLGSGKRLGLKEEEYNVGERGEITERWLASTVKAENRIGPADEGLSYVFINDDPGDNSLLLLDALKSSKELLMGEEYSKKYSTFGRLAKVFNFEKRLFYHLHQMQKDAELVGCNGKEEAYYFPEDVDLGADPVSFYGVHPYISDQKKYDLLLPYLIDWNSDLILKHSRGYLQVRGEGLHLPAGIPHAPGTACAIELQEESDVFANLQALLNGKILSKDTLFKNIRKEDRERIGESIILGQIDWEKSGDPYFYENRRTVPILIDESSQAGCEEYWIFYNTKRFSGKKLIVKPDQTCKSRENGAYNILVWKGQGIFDGNKVKANEFCYDEIIVTYQKAVTDIEIKNTGKSSELVLFKFFGPAVNQDVPFLKPYMTG